jgi:glyoxylase-like metal-dependent hydrolase (beta-lactamase superfamily II)
VIQIEQVAPGKEVVKLRMARGLLGRPAYFTAAYWVDGVLIDTGCAHTARQLVSTVKGWRVERVVNTHSHEDHIGANANIQETFNCLVQAHPAALPVLHNPRLQRLQPYRRLFWGWPRPCQAEALGEWVETAHHRLQVIPTPGHSPDHVCFFEPERGWLFSGDTYIGGRDRALRAGYDIHGVIASLRRLAELPVETIFSGSGSVHTDAVQRLREKVEYLEEVGGRIQSLHDQGVSRRQIRRQLFGRELPIAYITLGHFSSRHLVDSYLSPDGFQAGGRLDENRRGLM